MWIRILLGWIAAAALGVWIGSAIDAYRRTPPAAPACDAAGRNDLAARDCDA